MTDSSPSRTVRVGWGFDAHRLNDRPPVRLGGVIVSEDVGVEATSDGDVLSHAVTDAILGACVLGDLGEHFPSGDPSLANADSLVLLRQVATMAMATGFSVAHVDASVIVEKIRVAPYREDIRNRLAEALGVGPEIVSVKATTTDGLGYTGSSDGLAAVAVVTVAPT